VSLIGRCFVHPVFDYLVIGGGLSLVVAALVLRYPQHTTTAGLTTLAYLILFNNSAHFAASTVRLYTRPGAAERWPVLTMSLPLVFLAALAICLTIPDTIGRHALALILTWLPFHYAVQSYRLAVLYAHRSGCRLSATDARLMWWIALVPFIFVITSGAGLGLDWLLPPAILTAGPVDATLRTCAWVLPYVGFAGIVLLLLKTWRGESGPLPIISLLLLVTNAVWWFVLDPVGAFMVATTFHATQYLAIATILYVQEQRARPGNRRGSVHHVLWFYGVSVLLAYGLFNCLPWAFDLAGFGLLPSVALVVVAVNIHHFVVDALVWRLSSGAADVRQSADARGAVPA